MRRGRGVEKVHDTEEQRRWGSMVAEVWTCCILILFISSLHQEGQTVCMWEAAHTYMFVGDLINLNGWAGLWSAMCLRTVYEINSAVPQLGGCYHSVLCEKTWNPCFSLFPSFYKQMLPHTVSQSNSHTHTHRLRSSVCRWNAQIKQLLLSI